MGKYTVRFYGTAEKPMNYWARNRAANADGAVFYVDYHINSAWSKKANYTLTIVNKGMHRFGDSYAAARLHSDLVAKAFRLRKGYNFDGVAVQNGTVKKCLMPAIVPEPMFLSNPEQDKLLQDPHTINKLAWILAEVTRQSAPGGGLVGFSVGHRYRRTLPNRGAKSCSGRWEADYAEAVLLRAAQILTEAV